MSGAMMGGGGPAPSLGGAGMASMMGALSPEQGLSQDNAKMVSRERPVVPEARRKLVDQWVQDIQDAKRHWRRAFDRMRWNMGFVNGDQWQLQSGLRRRRRRANDAERIDRDDRYVANIALRHVLQRTAELYPANPIVRAKRRPRIMAANWDGTQAQLVQAQQAMMQSMQVGMPPPPEVQQILMDAEQVKSYDQLMDRIARTLELFYEYNVAEQVHPFQTMMKMTVRRAIVTGVGYVKIGFQRAMQMSPEVEARIADMSERLANIERLSADLADDQKNMDDAEAEQLRVAIASLTQEGGLIVREGLTFDYPDSTAIIPDPRCRALRGFVGADWVAQEYALYPDQIQEIYGVDIKSGGYTAYTEDGLSTETSSRHYEAGGGSATTSSGKGEPACVWEVYARRDGAIYVLCDGYPDFLQEPGRPETWLERFWPWFAIVLNEGYDDRTIYPQSDIDLLRDMQLELNRARQGLREHRRANRPKTAVAAGVLEEQDKDKLREHPANALLELNALAPGQKIDDVLQAVKPPPIDPAVYDTAPTFEDLLRVLGSDQAEQGTTSGATATEVSVAQFSQHTDLSSVVDDLKDTLTELARSAGQILLLNTSQQVVLETIGPGAVWPQLTAEMVAKNLWLEVEAGTDSLPRQQQEVQMFTQLIPLIQRIPGISPEWMARQLIRRLGSDVDLTDAFAEGMPSMEAMNQIMSRPPPAPGGPPGQGQGDDGPPNGAGRGPPRPPDPAQDPNAQGAQGLTNSITGPGTQGPLGPRVPPLQVFGQNGNRPGTGGGMPRMPARNQGMPTP